MDQQEPHIDSNDSLPLEEAPRPLPNHSEEFGNLPQPSATFRTVPNNAETFRSLPKPIERTDRHTMTVREAARMFETAGVARTERSIINWCQPNRQGVTRLDCYFDPNERRYYITHESVNRAMEEELARVVKSPESPSAGTNELPNRSEATRTTKTEQTSERDTERVRELEKEVLDLKITNRGKDFFIEQLQKEREHFATERRHYVDELITSNRKLGELETRLQLTAAKQADSERFESDANGAQGGDALTV